MVLRYDDETDDPRLEPDAETSGAGMSGDDPVGDDPEAGDRSLVREIRALRRELGRHLHRGTLVLAGAVALLTAMNALLWLDVAEHRVDVDIARRVELLTLIYGTAPCDPKREAERLEAEIEALRSTASDGEGSGHELRVLESRDPAVCPPASPLRLREEAVLTLARIDGDVLSLKAANLRRLRLMNGPFAGGDFAGVDLSGANLARSDFRKAFMRRAKAVGTYFKGADLRETDLRDADFSSSYLTDANLSAADLGNTKLRDANLIRTYFGRTEFKGTDLTGADVGGADFSDALHLTQAQLDSTRGNSKTQIPADLTRPAHWKKAGGDTEDSVEQP